MSTKDLFIGFEKKPEGLEEFLISEGYVPTKREETSVTYRQKDDLLVELDYRAQVAPIEDEDEIPDWEGSGFQIVADLSINFPFDPKDHEEGNRITEEVAKRFNAVFYDPNMGEYFKLN